MTPRPVNLTKAANEAIQLLTDASNKQLQLIADAALNATKLLAVQAAEAEKVKSVKGVDDHDFLLKFSSEVTVKLDTIRNDIKELSDGTASRITTLENEKLAIKDSYPVLYKAGIEKALQDHEDRIRINTGRITQILTYGSAGLIILGIAQFIISFIEK